MKKYRILIKYKWELLFPFVMSGLYLLARNMPINYPGDKVAQNICFEYVKIGLIFGTFLIALKFFINYMAKKYPAKITYKTLIDLEQAIRSEKVTLNTASDWEGKIYIEYPSKFF